MQNINLAGPPGFQDSKEPEKLEEHPKSKQDHEKTKSKNQKKQGAKKKSPKKKSKLASIMKKIAIIYLVLTVLLIVGDYVNKNYISKNEKTTKSKEVATDLIEQKINKKLDYLAKNISTSEKYLDQVIKGRVRLEIASTILRGTPDRVFIDTINILTHGVKGKIYFVNKNDVNKYQTKLTKALSGTGVNNYYLKDINGFSPFNWKLQILFNVDSSKLDQDIGNYYLAPDKDLAKIYASASKGAQVNLTRFWISSQDTSIIRNFIINGQGEIKNIHDFLRYLRQLNINVGYNTIEIINTEKSNGLNRFHIQGDIFPE